MKDRVAANPNRYAVYDDDHNFLRYEYHERADNPTEGGTPLNKAALLSDATAALINTLSGATPSTPNDALAAITQKAQGMFDGRLQLETISYTGTGTYGSSNRTSISFNIIPRIVILLGPINGANFFGTYGVVIPFSGFSTVPSGRVYYNGTSGYFTEITINSANKLMSWYATSEDLQMNATGYIYNCVAIG